MINRLIKMEIPEIVKVSEVKIDAPKGIYSISDYATSFINGMNDTQRSRFKKMLENDIRCGQSVASNYGIDYDEFIEEVKKQMEV